MGRGITRLADAGKAWVIIVYYLCQVYPMNVQVLSRPLPQVDCRRAFSRRRHSAKANGLRPQIQASHGLAWVAGLPRRGLLRQHAQKPRQPLDLLTQQVGGLQRLGRRIGHLQHRAQGGIDPPQSLGDAMRLGGGAMQGCVQARIGRRRHCSLPVTDSMQRSNASLVKGLAMKLFMPARWPRSIISRVAVPVIRMKPMRWVLGF